MSEWYIYNILLNIPLVRENEASLCFSSFYHYTGSLTVPLCTYTHTFLFLSKNSRNSIDNLSTLDQ